MNKSEAIKLLKSVMKEHSITESDLQEQPLTEIKGGKILEFKGVYGIYIGVIYENKGNNYYQGDTMNYGFLSLKSMLHEGSCVDGGHFTIHKVEREDGQIFEVGQDAIFGSLGRNKIEKFFINENGYIMVNKGEQEEYMCQLSRLQPISQPILTTHDGVQVFDENQDIYSVNSDYVKWVFKAKDCIFKGATKLFSTELAANEYIAENKPMYSIKDIEKQLEYHFGLIICQNLIANILNNLKSLKNE